MSGKGSSRRPAAVSEAFVREEYDRIFGKPVICIEMATVLISRRQGCAPPLPDEGVLQGEYVFIVYTVKNNRG